MQLRMRRLLREHFPKANVRAESDLLGAARALFQLKQGVACILGTGSNSGLYDGDRIVRNVPPLGFILGDEGSGAVMGKRFLGSLYKGLLPEDLKERFEQATGLSLPDAHHFRSLVEEAAVKEKIRLEKVLQRPMNGLVDYHTNAVS